MGIIQKQGIRSSAFIFLGFAIGAFNMLVLYPAFLTQSQLGITRALLDTSATLVALGSFGSISVIYKFYPFYKDYLSTKKNDLPLITLLVNVIGFLLILFFCLQFKPFIIRKLGKSPEFATYFNYIFPFTFLLMIYSWLEAFAWGLRKTVLTNFLRETFIRLFTTALLFAYAFHWITFIQFILGFCLMYVLPNAILLFTLLQTKNWSFNLTGLSSVTKRLKKKMFTFSMFIFGAHFLNVLAKTNDTFLIIGLRGLNETGVFAIAIYITALLDVPQRSLTITIPVLAEAWKNKRLEQIKSIYTKSVSNLLVIGIAMFSIIWLNVHNLTFFLNHIITHGKQDYSAIQTLVLILGIGKVIDLGTGVNSQIIATSNYWRFDFFTNVIYTGLSIPLNFFLIKYVGLNGLAFSNCIALVLYNSIRYVFLWKKFNLQPYNISHLWMVLSTILIVMLVYQIPNLPNIYFDTAIRTFAFTALFAIAFYRIKPAPSLQEMIDKNVNKFLPFSK